MQLRIFTEPQQGADYGTLLAVAQAAERLGFDAFFRSDHYLTIGGSGPPRPAHAWNPPAGPGRGTTPGRLGGPGGPGTFRAARPAGARGRAGGDRGGGGGARVGRGGGLFGGETPRVGAPVPAAGRAVCPP